MDRIIERMQDVAGDLAALDKERDELLQMQEDLDALNDVLSALGDIEWDKPEHTTLDAEIYAPLRKVSATVKHRAAIMRNEVDEARERYLQHCYALFPIDALDDWGCLDV